MAKSRSSDVTELTRKLMVAVANGLGYEKGDIPDIIEAMDDSDYEYIEETVGRVVALAALSGEDDDADGDEDDDDEDDEDDGSDDEDPPEEAPPVKAVNKPIRNTQTIEDAVVIDITPKKGR